MSLRCGCYDQADDIVFGPRHQCTTRPALTTPESVHADALQSELDRLEPLYRHVLSDDELEG
jgi:hypothetical protein